MLLQRGWITLVRIVPTNNQINKLHLLTSCTPYELIQWHIEIAYGNLCDLIQLYMGIWIKLVAISQVSPINYNDFNYFNWVSY